jgi:UDP-glucuronate 4-epimerase
LREVIAVIERLLGVELAIKWGPARPLDIPVSVVSIDRATNALGWRPKTHFETGIGITIDWAREYRPVIDKLFR